FERTPHRRLRHTLTEGDGGRFDDPAAAAAWRNGTRGPEFALDIAQLDAHLAVQAFGVAGVAVQLDHAVLRHARGLVEVVHVLRDDGAGAPFAHQAGDDEMTAVWLRAHPAVAIVEATPPRFAAHRLGGDEILEVDG